MAAATRAAGDKEVDGEGGGSDGDGNKEGDGEDEGEGEGGESDGDGKEDGEGGTGEGEGEGKEEGEGICNSVFGAPKNSVEPTQKKRSHIRAVAYKSEICDCDSHTQMRYGNAPSELLLKIPDGFAGGSRDHLCTATRCGKGIHY
jgi:hypothetical protein